MKKVNWGVLSTAKIGLEKVIPAIQRSQTGRFAAIASRDVSKAQVAAEEAGGGVAYGSYEDLIADSKIDAIYNPLPNHLHVPMTVISVQAGKHVLCEKPIALNAAEAQKLLELPEDKLIAEAFMVRAHPQWIKARALIREGALGDLKAIQCFFSYFNRDPHNIRNKADIGGGALLDIGCYAMLAGRYFFEDEPKRVVSLVDRDPDFETDCTSSALLDFGSGRHLTFSVSTQLTPYQRVQLVGTKKRLEIAVPFNAPQGEETRLYLDDGSLLGSGSQVTDLIPPSDHYAEMIDVFGRAVSGDHALPYGRDDAIQNMKILDALFLSETQ